MALNADAARVVEQVRISGRPPIETVPVAKARALLLRGPLPIDLRGPTPVAETRD